MFLLPFCVTRDTSVSEVIAGDKRPREEGLMSPFSDLMAESPVFCVTLNHLHANVLNETQFL